jgi:hypothetical protein
MSVPDTAIIASADAIRAARGNAAAGTSHRDAASRSAHGHPAARPDSYSAATNIGELQI